MNAHKQPEEVCELFYITEITQSQLLLLSILIAQNKHKRAQKALERSPETEDF